MCLLNQISTAGFSGDSSNVLPDSRSVILKTSCGFHYPVRLSILSPQIEIFQNDLRPLTLFNFRSATYDVAQWCDKFLEHAMLINMHEYFTGSDFCSE